MDFEHTSTVLPPSSGEEFTSGIDIDDLTKNYFHGYTTNRSLPIFPYRGRLINAINSNSVSIIEGATGCGKTTQVPVYILEDAIFTRRYPRSPVIYVTQPRKIAAKSIAQRVCDEHGWTMGTIVGYQVGLERVAGPETVLVFCTAGVLLQKLIQDKSLKNYSHIVIDEVHERDADTDLLLMMIKTLMKKEMSFFRLVVMSATMDMERLKDYFTFRVHFGHRAVTTASICKISQTKQLELQVLYFENFRSSFDIKEQAPAFDHEQPEIHDDCYKVAVKIILEVIPQLDTFNESTKSTLVFLPGLAEINKLHQLLLTAPKNQYIDVIPLHSCIAAHDQYKVFLPPKLGFRKVILATNIAESSITVRDAGFIVDFCLTKTLIKDPITRFPTLKIQWSTKDKSTQRAGRTGRCCPGKVFRMVTSHFYKEFEDYARPELVTAPLELSVLRVKNFQMGGLDELFSIVLDPPPMDEVKTAVLELKQVGALSSTFEGKISDKDGDITDLGRVISNLPIDIHLSKLIVIAAALDVLEEAVIVAACLSTNRSVVKHTFGNHLETYDKKLKWAKGSYSDLFVCLEVYDQFAYYKNEKNKDALFLDRFCKNHLLDERKLHEVASLVEELRSRLDQLNIRILDQPNRTRNTVEDKLILKVAFCAAFYPSYFLTKELDADDIRRQLGGLDPSKTLVLSNFPMNQVPLYCTQILSQLGDICRDYGYISDHSRALLTIEDQEYYCQDSDTIDIMGGDGVVEAPRDVPLSMYRAIKYSESNKLVIREYYEEEALKRMEYYRSKERYVRESLPNRLLPAWMKLVRGPANNRRLIGATDEEYSNIINHECHYEVSINEEQDDNDQVELYQLEEREYDRLKLICASGKKVEEIKHHIFKPDERIIRGPTSPAIMKFRPVLGKSRGYEVEIDMNSLNSILLDPDYAKKRQQMLVAASVTQANKRSRIVAHDTTLMPNIRGLPTIMGLLFAQYCRVVYNEPMKCIAGAILGLGWYENDEPIDSHYEVDLNFDVNIDEDDIILINKARAHTSSLIKFLDVHDPGAPRVETQLQLRQIILALMRKRRFPLTEIALSDVDFDEKRFVKDKHNIPESQSEEGQTRVFLPAIEISKNYTRVDICEALRSNIERLTKIAAGKEKPPIGGIYCLLCGNGYQNIMLMYKEISRHLYSENHLQKMEEFERFEQKNMGEM